MSKAAIDLYSGIGGWTLGMKLSGIDNIASYEWWDEANLTHNINFDTNHKEINIRNINVETDLKFKKKIDFVVGSPPCTQFSYANKGGNGNIEDGLIDIYKFLEVVEFIKPKFWAMENVPRVAKIIEAEIKTGGSLHRFADLIKVIIIVDSSDYGVPQVRKRMIAGDFPVDLFKSYKRRIKKMTMGEALSVFSKNTIVDPNYKFSLNANKLTDYLNEVDLSPEELRINKESKTFHPVYNGMSFPDKLDRPSRTITATCTRVSRESVIITSDKGYRRLNVRERGVLQGFPITYEFFGKTNTSKFKMIGNAVPPILTYYIFQSMLKISVENLTLVQNLGYAHSAPKEIAPKVRPDNQSRIFSAKRKFMFAIPHLRFGSGVRFELSNKFDKDFPIWSFKFIYGNSKSIKTLDLNTDIDISYKDYITKEYWDLFNHEITKLTSKYKNYNSLLIQSIWTHKCKGIHPFTLIDDTGDLINKLVLKRVLSINPKKSINYILEVYNNKKIDDNAYNILIGILVLSRLNKEIIKTQLHENRSHIFTLERV